MRHLILHITKKAVSAIVAQFWEEVDLEELSERAAKNVATAVRNDFSFVRDVASEIDVDDVADKVIENVDLDYKQIADNLSMDRLTEVLVDDMRHSVVNAIMEKLPTPMQALIEEPAEVKIDIEGKPELVTRLIDRAAEMLVNMAAEMAEKGGLDE